MLPKPQFTTVVSSTERHALTGQTPPLSHYLIRPQHRLHCITARPRIAQYLVKQQEKKRAHIFPSVCALGFVFSDGNGCRLNAGLPSRSLHGEMMSSWLLKITEHRRHSPCCQGDKANKHTGLPLSADGLLSVVLAKGGADERITQICDGKSCKNKGFVEGDDGRDAGMASSKNSCTYF